jgi:hypothetical protein
LFHCLALSFQVLVHACFRVWLLACSPNVRFMFGSFPVQILYLISLVVLVSFPIYNWFLFDCIVRFGWFIILFMFKISCGLFCSESSCCFI